jgi:predicted transposase YbfD/YdcC
MSSSVFDIARYFSTLQDPRIERQKLHSLSDILLIVFCGAICGAESSRDFVDFGHSKIDFLKRHGDLSNGIPSKNTFNRVISSLDPGAFRRCFVDWTRDFGEALGEVIAVDGKTLRRSHYRAQNQSAIHMVSAFASEARMVLAQQKVDDKSNEITAIPKLLELLSLNQAVVTIDAMGCQKAIAEQIVAQQGHYILAVKGNQPGLHEQIDQRFNHLFDMKHHKQVDVSRSEIKNRGRWEVRECLATSELSWLDGRSDWVGLKSCIVIESKRTVAEQTTTERRYYISSLEANAEAINAMVRAHWAIENSLHWTLDMVFGEDYSRIRTGNGAENMAMIRHVALNQLQAAKKHYPKDMSINRLRKKAGWDDDTLTKILGTRI